VSSGLVDTKLAYVQDRRVGAVASPPTGAPEFRCAPIGLDALRSQWGQRAHYQQHHQRECGRRPWRGIAPVAIGNSIIAGNPKRPGDLSDELRAHSHLLR
jgi:hypothetical protein